eukprot:jgi/Botrbrau1/4147/Bobra.0192s0017.1
MALSIHLSAGKQLALIELSYCRNRNSSSRKVRGSRRDFYPTSTEYRLKPIRVLVDSWWESTRMQQRMGIEQYLRACRLALVQTSGPGTLTQQLSLPLGGSLTLRLLPTTLSKQALNTCKQQRTHVPFAIRYGCNSELLRAVFMVFTRQLRTLLLTTCTPRPTNTLRAVRHNSQDVCGLQDTNQVSQCLLE